jgi:hypothetical protein
MKVIRKFKSDTDCFWISLKGGYFLRCCEYPNGTFWLYSLDKYKEIWYDFSLQYYKPNRCLSYLYKKGMRNTVPLKSDINIHDIMRKNIIKFIENIRNERKK